MSNILSIQCTCAYIYILYYHGIIWLYYIILYYIILYYIILYYMFLIFYYIIWLYTVQIQCHIIYALLLLYSLDSSTPFILYHNILPSNKASYFFMTDVFPAEVWFCAAPDWSSDRSRAHCISAWDLWADSPKISPQNKVLSKQEMQYKGSSSYQMIWWYQRRARVILEGSVVCQSFLLTMSMHNLEYDLVRYKHKV